MILTGIAHAPTGLFECSPIPSIDLISFARLALQQYPGACLLTSLEPGWDLALAKAAIELEIPYDVILQVQSLESSFPKALQPVSNLLLRAYDIKTVAIPPDEDICHWRITQADQVVALWNQDFHGATFRKVAYALDLGKPVCNLWREWEQWIHLRRNRSVSSLHPWRGARVFTKS